MGVRANRAAAARIDVKDHGAIAAVDCGTNSTRLLVVDRSGDTIVREMRITRLGEGVDATGTLSPSGVDRTSTVLKEFRALMDAAGVQQSKLVATSAVRDAKNGAEFLNLASQIICSDAELLSGTEEGRLAFAGATAGLAVDQRDAVVLDIGGGSTELVRADNGHIQAFSMKLGCVRLTERYLLSDPPQEAEIREAIRAIRTELAAAFLAVPSLDRPNGNGCLIGLAGTISTLAGLELGMERYERDPIHHFNLTSEAVGRWCQILAGETSKKRGRRSEMLAGRQDVIVGGALVLRETMARLGARTCVVSESDILDGLVLSML
jgi:exopolyphosphatase/guanosine-5'-triphosphate,3'-diphosphate pyrophosphatase